MYKMVPISLKKFIFRYITLCKSLPRDNGRFRDDFFCVLCKPVYFKTYFIIGTNQNNVAT